MVGFKCCFFCRWRTPARPLAQRGPRPAVIAGRSRRTRDADRRDDGVGLERLDLAGRDVARLHRGDAAAAAAATTAAAAPLEVDDEAPAGDDAAGRLDALDLGLYVCLFVLW